MTDSDSLCVSVYSSFFILHFYSFNSNDEYLI